MPAIQTSYEGRRVPCAGLYQMFPAEYFSEPAVQIIERDTSANTDVLAGTLLANAGPGRYLIYARSSVDTATISITAPGQQIADAEVVPEGPADIHIDIDSDPPWIMDIPDGGGQQPTIAIAGTTGTFIVLVRKVS